MADDKRYSHDDHPAIMGTLMERQQRELVLCRDVYAGTLRLQDRASVYLPRWPKEDGTSYRQRVAFSALFNAFRQTVAGMTGMVYRVDPEIGEHVPDLIREDLEDIDLQGRDLAAFGRDHFEDAWVDGHAAIFVDMERPAGGMPRTRAEERALGMRPYWVGIRKSDLLRASVTRENGRMLLQRIAWFERTVEPAGAFGDREVTRVRELERGPVELPSGGDARGVHWRLYRQQKEGDDTSWVVEDSGVLWSQQGRPLPEIPVAASYTGFAGEWVSEPPLLDLAIENLRHFRKTSDLDNIEHLTCVPIFTVSGVDEDEFQTMGIGPGIALLLNDPSSRAAFAEINGSGIQQVRESTHDIERRMAILGLSMMMPEAQTQQTATWKRIQKSESDSRLSVAARAHQMALNKALWYHAMWRGIEMDDTEAWITVNRDFEEPLLPPDVMSAYVKAVSAAGLPVRVLLDVWQQGGRIPRDQDLDELEAEMLAAGTIAEAQADSVPAVR